MARACRRACATAHGLARALGEIARLERDAPSPALRNIATAALLIAAAAYAPARKPRRAFPARLSRPPIRRRRGAPC